MSLLKLYMVIPKTEALGPFQRYSIWVQGCPFRCRGCMTPNALSFDGGTTINVADLAKDILLESDIEGITISGGEPSHQAGPLTDLIESIRKEKDLGVVAYSGYTLYQLQARAQKEKDVARFLNSIDLLIDGQYQEELNDGKSLRGSSNQLVHSLTNRYRSVIDEYYGQPKRQVEVHMRNDDFILAGIPGADFLQKWKGNITKGEI